MEHAIELRAALRGGAGPLLGFWATIPSPLTAEVAAAAGADYVVVDQQHGAVGPTTMLGMLQAIRLGGAAPLVRVAANDAWTIGHALDLGAIGVIVPMVDSPEEAAQAVAACRYATEGVRSVGVLRGTSGAGAPEPPLCLVLVACKAADRLCGLHCLTAQDVARFAGDGFALITMGGDLAYLRTALDSALTVARGR
jgi:2-keto-3-deoxy-L-rhamnonate aldolase RhmA